MTFELAAVRSDLPIFSKASSFTGMAGGNNDPYQALKEASNIEVLALYAVRAAILKLQSLEPDWDGFGSLQPNSEAVKKAWTLVGDLYDSALETRLPWIQPHVASSEDGNVVFEWWSGSHKLTLYISDESCEYVQVWGPDMNAQMRDGTLVGDQFQGLWRWLLA